ncbi:adenosylmethionine decarboxylase [Endozoicomonas sp.]|uniref:adenosylmethionine decarboxylase n=1 Tax=Endozoicomonas sp. TaxID=1892382 RepID=UPI002887A194|nr:adenosylmethionine decarboxylase [Endozoicomonas sp.]
MSSFQNTSDPADKACHWQEAQVTDDHFIESGGKTFAGYHLLVDLWQSSPFDIALSDMPLMRAALKECVDVCNATLLHIHLHHFEPNGGISGVAVLAESHISVHTWPERSFAAFDIFMCGNATPHNAIAILQRTFNPKNLDIRQELRGLVHQQEPATQNKFFPHENI